MSMKKFAKNEILVNTMRTYPHCEFFIFDGNVYYNQRPNEIGDRNSTVRNVPMGHTSLYELNIDRPLESTGRGIGTSSIPDTGRIVPWISKDSAGSSFKTVGKVSYANEFQFGDILISKYPLSASLTREYVAEPSSSAAGGGAAYNANYFALRNALNNYSSMSEHYAVTSSYGNKDTTPLNLLYVPSIFYGTKIKPGTVSLKWFFTGSATAELKDSKENGELIQVSASNSTNNNKVAGVVLYNEGIVLLTGSWALNNETMDFSSDINSQPKWIHFGAGAGDGNSRSSAGSSFGNSSYNISFKGHNETQVMTMFAHAKRGEVNYSNNPTFLQYGQEKLFLTSSNIYQQSDEIKLKNFVSSSYLEYSAPFKRQVYISKIAIFDKYKNLVGVATLSSPILKESNQQYTFKLKLDL